MVKAIFIQNPSSIYKDRPGERYHFPRKYLGVVEQTIGDWVIFYEGRKGAFGYVAVQQVTDIIVDPELDDHYYAILELNQLLGFETVVPRINAVGHAFETVLRKPDGTPMSGGANVSAVRRISDADFAAIIDAGLTPMAGPDVLPRDADLILENDRNLPGFNEEQSLFEEAPISLSRSNILSSRKYRDQTFARQVKTAYRGVCAISGLELRNGGGRPEVQAAHIRPVSMNGPDIVQNGIALSGTLHWMFDRGLISVAEDMQILISHNKSLC